MKILIFIYNLHGGGAERVTVNLANYWVGKGWDITIVTMVGPETDFYRLDERIKRFSLGLGRDSHNPVSALTNNLLRVVALRKILKREKPDVAMGLMTSANCLLALAAFHTKIPVVGTERIYPPLMPTPKIWNWLRQKTYPHFDAIVALTRESSRWLQTNTGARNVSIIPNAVFFPIPGREPRVSPYTVVGTAGKLKLMIAVGRLDLQKNFDGLIQAFMKAISQVSGWRLVILGEGPERAKLEALILNHGLVDHVILPGAVGNIGEWYEAADLLVMTSRFEGFPNVLIEAMSYGLPVVSVDCDTGPRDIIRHELDGLLIPQHDEKALVDAMVSLMKDEKLRKRYAECAVEVRHRFSLEKVNEMWEALFNVVIKQK